MHAIVPVLADVQDDVNYLNTIPDGENFIEQVPSKHYNFLATNLANAMSWFSDLDEMKPFDDVDRLIVALLVELLDSHPVIHESHHRLIALKSFQVRYVTKNFGSNLPVTLNPIYYPQEWNGVPAVEMDLV